MTAPLDTTDMWAGINYNGTEPTNDIAPVEPPPRAVRLTPAADIHIRPVHWLWTGRLALGTLALLGGREGIGKSTLAYQIAADITRGHLSGVHEGEPRAVIVAATEDSWEHTIVPRLIGAKADLRHVYRVDVTTPEGHETEVILPRDLVELEKSVRDVNAALILLDPLMSRLDAKLDSHKDAEVRLALEPLVKLANATATSVLGLIHVNKSQSTDPLTLLMGSRAFAAVARAVLFVITDPDDETIRMLGQPKNNLGRTDLPTLTFRIDSHHVADTDEGPVFTGRINWQGETDRSIREILQSTGDAPEERNAVKEAAAWLIDYLTGMDGTAPYKLVVEQGRLAGHSVATLKRARATVHVVSEQGGYPPVGHWRLPLGSSERNDNKWTPSSILKTLSPPEPNGQTETPPPLRSSERNDKTPTTPRPESPNRALSSTPVDLNDDNDPTEPVYPSISARAQGDTHVDLNEENTPLRSTSPLSPPDERNDAGICPNCEWPLDNQTHHDICGAFL